MRYEKINYPSLDFFRFLNVVNSLHGVKLYSRRLLTDLAEWKDFEIYKITSTQKCTTNKAVTLFIEKTINENPELSRYIKELTQRSIAVIGNEQNISFISEVMPVGHYETFRKQRDILLAVVNKDYEYLEEISLPGEITVNDNGELTHRVFGFEMFQNVDMNRLRVCSVCEKNIFWAKRADAKYCSKTCSNRISQRNYLADESTRYEYNEKRREIYKLKKDGIVK